PRLLSVGHSNHDAEGFLRLLRGAGVGLVADVRSRPFSGRWPHFNRPELERALRAAGIGYVFLGDQLGGRPGRAGLYTAEGRADYEGIRRTPEFNAGLDRLIGEAERGTVAMLCSEADPLDCHRGLMIAPALVARGLAPGHLRRDGTVETTAEVEARLLAETKVGEGITDGLFAALVTPAEREQLLAEAYRVMACRKAYQLPAADTEERPDEDADA
ncbi:MAG TPA: DUF488 domain-containing protein, partial [Gemmataceae bacterium]|nr:DUF488 domain-containing protein [Gemmataceae bacterium]